MSVTLISSPFPWSWARNRNFFRFLCSSSLSVGTSSNSAWLLDPIFSLRIDHLRFVVLIDEHRYTFSGVLLGGGAWTFTSLSDLVDKLSTNYYISQLFTITYTVRNDQSIAVAFNAVAPGCHTVDLFYESTDGTRLSNDEAGIHPGHNTPGTDPTSRSNYSLAVALDVLSNNCNSVSSHSTGWMFFQPDPDGYLDVPLDMLASFIPQPDIPAAAEPLGLSLLTNLFLKYRIRYAECWGDTPLIQSVATSPWFYAIAGEVSDYYHRLNLPDWLDHFPSDQLSTVGGTNVTCFRVIGEDDNLSIDVHASQPEFLTIFYLNASEAINSSVSLRLRVVKTAPDGTSTTSWSVFTVRNGNFYRLSVGPAALSATTSAYYSVTLFPSGNTPQFSRTYRLIPDFYSQHLFLLQNQWGILSSFVAASMAAAAVAEGESLHIRHRHYVSVSDRYQSFTATSAALRPVEARRLARSLASAYHYYFNAGAWQRIAIEPASVTFRNDEEDLVTLQFSFRFVENQTDNLPSNSVRSNSNTVTVDIDHTDDADAYLSFDTRLIPSTNALHETL